MQLIAQNIVAPTRNVPISATDYFAICGLHMSLQGQVGWGLGMQKPSLFEAFEWGALRGLKLGYQVKALRSNG